VETTAEIVHRARATAGLSQQALADLAGTSQPALARYERGSTIPSLPTLERLVSACGAELRVDVIHRSPRTKPRGPMRAQLGSGAQKLRRRRRKLLDAANRHGLENVRVFGSLARGTDHAASDADFLVDLRPGSTLLDVAAFKHEAQEILGMRVDAASFDMLKPRIRSRVAAEARPL